MFRRQLDAVGAPLGHKMSWHFDWVYSARHEPPLVEQASDQLVFLYVVVHSCVGDSVLQFVMNFREWITVNTVSTAKSSERKSEKEAN